MPISPPPTFIAICSSPFRASNALRHAQAIRPPSHRIHSRTQRPIRTAAFATAASSPPKPPNLPVHTRAPHTPVLRDAVTKHFSHRHIPIFVDGTVGAGGHAAHLLKHCDIGTYIGLDKDPSALSLAAETLRGHDNVRLVQCDFRDVRRVLAALDVSAGSVGGLLLDLGVSSMQLETGARGFSFQRDGPLDMRMSGGWDGAASAMELVNGLSEEDLEHVLRSYGEERLSRQIAREIVRARETEGEIDGTLRLAEVVERVKKRGRRGGMHPATLTFQALRIRVNGELEALRDVLEDGVLMLERGVGRMGVISFHSLEDRMVKQEFRRVAGLCGGVGLVTKRAVVADDGECRMNVRSRSARFRVVQRLREDEEPWGRKVNKYRVNGGAGETGDAIV